MNNRLTSLAYYTQKARKGACFTMFPLITNMEEFLIYMGGGFQYLPAHLGNESGGAGFPSESLPGDTDTQAVTGPGNRDV